VLRATLSTVLRAADRARRLKFIFGTLLEMEYNSLPREQFLTVEPLQCDAARSIAGAYTASGGRTSGLRCKGGV
jgi:hypothetical protein